MRIALILTPFSSAQKIEHAPNLARELLGQGHTVRGFGARPGLIPRSHDDVPDFGLTTPLESVGVLAFEPDLVLAYDIPSPAAWHGARVARKLRVPLVLIERGVPSEQRPESVLRSIGTMMWGRGVRRVTSRVVALDSVARKQALRLGYAAERVEVLPSGVDIGHFRPGLSSALLSRHGIRGRILLHVGPLREERGIGVLASAFARTVGRRDDWSMVLCGDGRDYARLRAQVDRLGIGAQVHWLPKPRREELPGLMGASTLFAAPHLEDPASTTSVRRALACGLPVLASDLPRLRELVSEDTNGLLADPGDLESWTRTLQLAAGAPTRRARWCVEARRAAVERLSWTRIGQRMGQMLSRLTRSGAEIEELSDDSVEEPGSTETA